MQTSPGYWRILAAIFGDNGVLRDPLTYRLQVFFAKFAAIDAHFLKFITIKLVKMSVPQRAELNWQRCAELHNRLLEIGWVPVLKETDWKQDTTTWWEEYFGQDKDIAIAEELEHRLEPSVVKFLQATINDYPGNEGDEHLFYYIQDLVTPEEIIKSLNQDAETGVPDNRGSIIRVPPPGVPVTLPPERYIPDNTDDRFVWLYRIPGEKIGGL